MKITTFQQYTELAARTASYPPEHAVEYTALGLISEIGELAGKLKRPLRGDGELDRDGVIAELGDVLWYFAMYCKEQRTNIPAVINEERFCQRPGSLVVPGLGFVHVGFLYKRFAEVVLQAAFHFYIDEAVVIYDKLEMCCWKMGLSVAEVAERNIAKLADRAARGVIKGSGDKR